MLSKTRTVGVIGLGYVGLPVAIEFGKVMKTIGFDINSKRIASLKSGTDHTGEASAEDLSSTRCEFTDDLQNLKPVDFFIVAVPTPVDEAKQPDLTLLRKASESVGKVLKKGDIVVYESTVYPGCTEEVCGPVLEKVSGLKSGVDFFLGYSPERINPGDKEHRLTQIKKVVSGQTPESARIVSDVYAQVITAGVFEASSIKVAEAAKVIENTQRDLNIALMNELSLIFNLLGIKTKDVLEAASTKWNFLNFHPGLVGGHCIGVDPYYLTHKAQTLGYQPEVILAGRRINDHMGSFIVQQLMKMAIQSKISMVDFKVSVLGLTFKEDCPDTRNTRVVDIIQELKNYGIEVQVADPVADTEEAHEEYGLKVHPMSELKPADAVIVAVAHQEFKKMMPGDLNRLFKTGTKEKILIDVKGIFSKKSEINDHFKTWSL